jgi:radical SAM protein with 4Fe4S-binding SPASM domain
MNAVAARNPYYIDWAITCRCNLRCTHCRGMPPEELSTERALSLLDEMAALKPGWVLIEGGEPLLRDDLFPLLRRARELDLTPFLISNGMLITEETVDHLGSLGVRIMISIDSPDPRAFEVMRQGAVFSRVVRAAASCAGAGLLDAINFTLSRGSFARIPDLFRLAKEIGAKRINILGLKPCEHYGDKLLAPAEYRRAIEMCCRASIETQTRFFFDEPFFQAGCREWGLTPYKTGEGSSITIESEPGCIIGKYLFISASGDVWPCSFSPLVIGNAARERLPEIWRRMGSSALLKRLTDPRTRKGACNSCRHLAACKGCRARAFNLTGDWFAADPACPLPQG